MHITCHSSRCFLDSSNKTAFATDLDIHFNLLFWHFVWTNGTCSLWEAADCPGPACLGHKLFLYFHPNRILGFPLRESMLPFTKVFLSFQRILYNFYTHPVFLDAKWIITNQKSLDRENVSPVQLTQSDFANNCDVCRPRFLRQDPKAPHVSQPLAQGETIPNAEKSSFPRLHLCRRRPGDFPGPSAKLEPSFSPLATSRYPPCVLLALK